MRIALLSLVALSACRNTQSSHTVRMTVPNAGLMIAPIYVAQSLGEFTKNGMEIELAEMTSAAKALEGLVGGSADVTVVTHAHVLQLAAEGRAVQSFVSLTQGDTGVMVASPVAKPPIRQISDMKGRKAGVTGFGSSSHLTMNWFLQRGGLAKEDVQVIAAGSITAQAAALEQGRIDSGMLGGSAFIAMKRRHPQLVVLAEARTPQGLKQQFGVESLAGFSLTARPEWLRSNPESARKLARAVTAAMRWMMEHSAAEIRERMPEQQRMEDVQADLEAIRDAVVMLTPSGHFREDGLEASRRLVAATLGQQRVSAIDLSKTYTNELVKERP